MNLSQEDAKKLSGDFEALREAQKHKGTSSSCMQFVREGEGAVGVAQDEEGGAVAENKEPVPPLNFNKTGGNISALRRPSKEYEDGGVIEQLVSATKTQNSKIQDQDQQLPRPVPSPRDFIDRLDTNQNTTLDLNFHSNAQERFKRPSDALYTDRK